MSDQFRTSRLTLRPWDPDSDDDVTTAFDIYRPDEVARWLGARPAPWSSVDAARERLRRWQRAPQDHPGYGLWAVVPDSVGTPVGTVLLVHLRGSDDVDTTDVEVGWHFHPEHWGHGYATEAASRLLDHAFTDLGLDTVNAVAYPGNERSTAVMQRLGMRSRGETDRWYGATLEWWSVER
ncbi:MAG: GNAT family N-acetyltransferase [Actinomycetes bacterium]